MKHGFIKRLARKLAILFAALLAVFVLFILEENLRGRILLARYKAELRAKGEKLTLEELNLPKPSKPSDAATDILLAGWELEEFSKRCPFAISMISGLRFVQPGCCLVRCAQVDSGLKLLNVNAGIGRGGGRKHRGDEDVPQGPPPVQMCSWDQFAEQVALTREPLRKARAALRQPVLGVPIDYSQGFEARIPQATAATSVAKWLAAAALDDLRHNRFDSALEDTVAIAALMRLLQHDRLVILQTTRFVIGEKGLDITWEALQAPGWNDTQLAKLQTAWENASVINEFEPSTEVERADVLEHWNSVVHKPMHELLGWSEMNMLSWDDLSRLLRGIVWYAAWRQQDQARGVWLWTEGVDAVRTAVAASKWTVARDVFKKTQQDEWNHHWIFYDQWRYQMSIPDMPSGTTWGPENFVYDVKRLLEYETRREMTMAAIALKRFELRYNKLAPDLAALVPGFLARVPYDYMDGGNLRYRLKGDSDWVLYSVGENCVDDGGDATSSEPRSIFFSIWDSRDAVWPKPATTDDAARGW